MHGTSRLRQRSTLAIVNCPLTWIAQHLIGLLDLLEIVVSRFRRFPHKTIRMAFLHQPQVGRSNLIGTRLSRDLQYSIVVHWNTDAVGTNSTNQNRMDECVRGQGYGIAPRVRRLG